MLSAEHFDVKLTSREVSAWGGLALLKKMIDGIGVFQAIQSRVLNKHALVPNPLLALAGYGLPHKLAQVVVMNIC